MRGLVGDKERLLHILDAINEIQSYTSGITESDFLDNSMMVHATINQLQIIGEACNRVSDATKNLNPEIDWRKIVGLRNILVHEYFGVDRNLIWQIVKYDIPELKKYIIQLVDTEDVDEK